MIPYAGAPRRNRKGWPKGKVRKEERHSARIDIFMSPSIKCALVAQAFALGVSTSDYVRQIIVEDIERRMKASPVPEGFKWPPAR